MINDLVNPCVLLWL